MSSEEEQTASSRRDGRPSLGGSPGPKQEQLSILASVEGASRSIPSASTRRGGPWLALALLGVMAAGYFVSPMLSSSADPGSNPVALRDEPRAAPAAAVAASAVALAAHAADDSAAAPAHGAARIETMASIAGTEPPGADALMRLVPAMSAQASAESPSNAAPTAGDAAGDAQAPVVVAKLARPVTTVPKKRPAPQRAAPAREDHASEDADVDLLAALMAHVSREGGTPTSMHVQPATHVAMAHTSIADLVRSCNVLSAAAASQCRQRICEGYWGKAEACPVKSRRAR